MGLAWDPWGNGRTSIRSGAGLFHERIRQNVNNFDGLGNPPLLYTPTVYAGHVDHVSPALIVGGTCFPVNLSTFDEAGQILTVYSWSLGVQRELGKRTSLDVSYGTRDLLFHPCCKRERPLRTKKTLASSAVSLDTETLEE